MAEHAAKVPVEKKVTAATVGSFAASALVAVLNAWVGNEQLLGSLPGWLQTILIAFGPTVVTFASGYYAKHTPRPVEDDTVVPKSL
jgi:hypothetical protein